MTSIYIGNITYSATERDIEQLFSQFGEVASVKLINDRETGRPKGFGFVEMHAEA
ncbi:MAG: RNA-binding protein, partial [Helicobacter sp.]|nr:RNA-binding protein [Helicobacter sp.]